MSHFYELRPLIVVPGVPAGTPIHIVANSNTLFQRGVLMQVQLSTSSLVAVNQKIPVQTISIWGLLDTGCTVTSIDAKIASHLQLMPTGMTTTLTASGPAQTSTYAVDLAFAGQKLRSFKDHPIGSCNLNFDLAKHLQSPGTESIGMLIGRDLMREWSIVWHGPSSTVLISD